MYLDRVDRGGIMAKLKIFLKTNKMIFFVSFVILFIISFSFVKYFKDNFQYADGFYKLEEKCFSKKAGNYKFCTQFSSEKEMKTFFKDNNPKIRFANLDAITLTCEIVENELFSILQLLAPLLIIISVVGAVNGIFNTGMFKYYLTRVNYRTFLKTTFKKVFKIALIIPCSLIIIFIISCLITKFNFNVSESTKIMAVYSKYKYNNFLLYGIVICVLQYLMSIVYGTIALFSSTKNKNPVISVIVSYVIFLLEYLFVYIGVYVIIINKILGFKDLTDYFNITGYWFFDENINYLLLILIASLIAVFNFIFIYYKLINKEKVVMEYEKQIS